MSSSICHFICLYLSFLGVSPVGGGYWDGSTELVDVMSIKVSFFGVSPAGGGYWDGSTEVKLVDVKTVSGCLLVCLFLYHFSSL